MKSLPIDSATMFLIYSSSFLLCSTSRGSNLAMYSSRHLLLCIMISLMVLRNKYFSWGSALSTSANTRYRKKSGLPMDMFPRQMEAAVRTSSLGYLNRADTWSIRLGTADKSVNLPNSPRHKAPFNWLSLPCVVILARNSCCILLFYYPLIAICAIALAAGCALRLT